MVFECWVLHIMRPLSRFIASSGFALALTFILTFKGLNRDACFLRNAVKMALPVAA